MDLIIVESPTKANTIKKFLGRNYKVLSSFGHIRDLPKNELGIDVKKDFKPKYVVPLKSRKTTSLLKKESQGSKKTILATDEDREGEAIAWHLSQVLKLDEPERIVFHEITKTAISQAIKNPRKIDMGLVDSQQARRILDRIVGYKLSPFLWKKVARGLSAGRVQSIAVRLVADREQEIKEFVSQEYWIITATLKKLPTANSQLLIDEFESSLTKIEDKIIPKSGIKTKKEADKILKDLKDAEYKVENIEKKETKKNPLPPFTTSSLQQEAWKKFRFPSKFTMSIAQQLYEKGHITYHRTDSLNLSQQSLFSAKKFVEENFGKEYWAGFFRQYKAKGKVQEAHEAIRPTFPNKTPGDLKLEKNQHNLYNLIWQRFTACQMAQAIFDSTKTEISAKNPAQYRNEVFGAGYTFQANGQTLKFDGFLKIYPIKFQETQLPLLEKSEILDLKKITPSQHFTEPPPRYNEASLIKALEENGVGRPSTYAPTLSTIQERNYIEKDEQKRFRPTEIGTVVNNILVSHFPEIVNIKFTAKMEDELDLIAQGKEKWTKVCEEFYAPFSEHLEKKYKEVSKEKISVEKTDKKCPLCGSPVLIRLGRYGKFYACSNFPKCKYTDSLEKNGLGIKCPKCEKGEIVEKRTRLRRGYGGQGKIFYGCNRFPDCDFALWDRPTGEKCPLCGSLLIETKKKQIKCSNKDCHFVKKVAE